MNNNRGTIPNTNPTALTDFNSTSRCAWTPPSRQLVYKFLLSQLTQSRLVLLPFVLFLPFVLLLFVLLPFVLVPACVIAVFPLADDPSAAGADGPCVRTQ